VHKFRFSENEARRMRRGVYLFPLIILPFVAVFGMEPGKSQPAHFLIVLSIGLIISGIFLGIGRAGVNAQIRNARATSLTVLPDRLEWSSDIGQSELLFCNIATVIVVRRFGKTRSIVLKLKQGNSQTVGGYDRMQDLAGALRESLPEELIHTRTGFLF
jgi:hypothetical protein